MRELLKVGLYALLLFSVQLTVYADDKTELIVVDGPKKTIHWWEQRNKRNDIHYPHNAHDAVMKKGGDTCLLCHTFSKNRVTNLEQLKKLNVIANEPLEAICHDCHVTKLTAPWECDLCHQDAREIWPNDHNFDYIDHHGEDAGLDEGECNQCHIDKSFCSDCHFRRDPMQRRSHPLGYRSSHGFDARMNAANCATCHNVNDCGDCHKALSK